MLPGTFILFPVAFYQGSPIPHPSYSSVCVLFCPMVGIDIFDIDNPPYTSSITGSFDH